MMVMGLFSVFWLSFGLLQLPSLGLAAAYSPTGDAAEGAASPEFNAVIGLYLIVWGFALFTFLLFTLKTNSIFALIFLFVTMASWTLAGAYFRVASGDYGVAGSLQTVVHPIRAFVRISTWLTSSQAAGAMLFIVALLGWYMCFVIMAAEMRLGINFWVGDLSHFWPSANVPIADEKRK